MLQALEGKSIGSKKVKVADVIPQSFEKKAKQGPVLTNNSQHSGEAAVDDAEENSVLDRTAIGYSNSNASALDVSSMTARSVRDVVTPLAHMPYGDQLEHKKNSLVQILKKLVSDISMRCFYCIMHLTLSDLWTISQ